MSNQIFKRYERKFLISKEQKEQILNNLSDYLVLDDHTSDDGYYNVYSIYYDDKYNSIIRNSISKPVYKEKLRVRSYKLNLNNDDLIFIELKKKYNKVGNKRRIKIKYQDYLNFDSNSKIKFDNYLDEEIYEEIKNYIKVNKCQPKIYISCLRQAYFCKNDVNIRVTFDSDIKYRRTNIAFVDGKDELLLESNLIVMEVKFPYAFPFEILEEIKKINVFRQPFSKYGKIYEKELKEVKENVFNKYHK